MLPPRKAVDELLKEAHMLSLNGDDRFDEIDFNDVDLHAKLQKIARFRNLTLDDLEQAYAEVDRETSEQAIRALDEMFRCQEKREDLRIFYVINTANSKQTVLARDAKCARFYALRSGHIRDEKNGRVLVLKADREAELRTSGKALGRALRAGYPGVVMEVGDNVVMEGSQRVYLPITMVEN